MRIAVAADHNGVALKQLLVSTLERDGNTIDDGGVHSRDAIVDFPPICEDLAQQVTGGKAERAIMIGGTGSGEQVALNKITGIRAGLCHCRLTAEISRAHNDANVLVMGAKVVSVDEATVLARLWRSTVFKGPSPTSPRPDRRV